jgi:hypothetical protein
MDILMNAVLKFLLLFIRPAIDDPADDPDLQLDLGGTDDPPPQDDPPADDPPADDPPADDPPAPPAAVDRAAIEREVSERYEREMAQLRANQRHAEPVVDKDVAEWNRILADPNADAQTKWYAQSNLEIRKTTTFSQTALAQALDVSDRTAFSALANTEPGLYKRYAPMVEDELAKMRQRGGNARREEIYTYLLGKEMREGKFTKKKSAPKPGASTSQPAVARGRLPGARSDVGGKGAMTEHEKRTKRLEGVSI